MLWHENTFTALQQSNYLISLSSFALVCEKTCDQAAATKDTHFPTAGFYTYMETSGERDALTMEYVRTQGVSQGWVGKGERAVPAEMSGEQTHSKAPEVTERKRLCSWRSSSEDFTAPVVKLESCRLERKSKGKDYPKETTCRGADLFSVPLFQAVFHSRSQFSPLRVIWLSFSILHCNTQH